MSAVTTARQSISTLGNNLFIFSSVEVSNLFWPKTNILSFVNLLKHSLSIIAVFKTALLIRSVLFLIAYLFLVIGKISIITLMPVIGIVIMMLSVIFLSKRENMQEYESSLENIESIDKIKWKKYLIKL